MNIIEIFKLFGSIMVDSTDAEKSISKTEKGASGLGAKLGDGIKTAAKWGAAIAVGAVGAAAAIGAMAAPLVRAAADAQAMQAQFDQVFAELSKSATDSLSKIAEETGMLPNRLKGSFTAMAAFAKTTGMDTADALALTERATLAAADGAAFYDKSIEEVSNSLQSFLKGNYANDAALGISATETTRNAAANKLYGKSFKDLDEAQKQLTLLQMVEDGNKLSGALGQAALESDAFENQLGNLKQAWQDIKAKFGEPILEPAVAMIQKLAEWLVNVDVQPFIDAIDSAISFVKDFVQNIISWMSEWRSNNEDALKNIWENFQTRFTEIWEKVKTVFENIQVIVMTVFEFVKGFIEEALSRITEFWELYGEQLVEKAITTFNTIKETVMTVFNAIWDVIKNILDLVVPFVQKQLDKLKEFWETNGAQIMEAVKNAFNIIMAIVDFAMKHIKRVFDYAMPVIIAVIKGAWAIISSIFETVLGAIMGTIKFWISVFTGDWEGMKEGILKVWTSLWNGIKGVLEGAWTLLSGVFGALWDNISDWFTGLKDKAVEWGKNMITGFIDGIMSMVNKVKDAVGGIIGKVGDFMGFGSPTKEGEGRNIVKWGRNMVDGFLEGVIDESDRVGGVMDGIVKRMQPSALTGIGVVGSSVSKQTSSGVPNNNPVIHIENITIDAKNVREFNDVVNLVKQIPQVSNAFS